MIICQERHALIARGKDERTEAVAFAARTIDKSLIVYTMCTKTSHSVSECFQILGYLEWWSDRAKNSGQNCGGCGRHGNGRTGHGHGGCADGRSTSGGCAHAVHLTPISLGQQH